MIQNSKSLSISSLIFKSMKKTEFSHYENFRLEISNGRLETIAARGSGAMDEVSSFVSEVDKLRRDLKPWYSLISKRSFEISILSVVVPLVGLVLYIEFFGNISSDPDVDQKFEGSIFIGFLMVVIGLFL